MAWALSALVVLLAFIAWGGGIKWDLGGLSTYELFPLFGLTAFSLMWSMYVVGFARRTLNPAGAKLKGYYQALGWAVLVLIVLHPALLIYQLWRDGFGLPPGSYSNYVSESLKWVVILGMVSLLIFLAYELRRVYGKKTWWKYVEYAGDAAMIAVFYHGLRLGGELNSGWFRSVWIFYGVVLAVILIQKYYRDYYRKYYCEVPAKPENKTGGKL